MNTAFSPSRRASPISAHYQQSAERRAGCGFHLPKEQQLQLPCSRCGWSGRAAVLAACRLSGSASSTHCVRRRARRRMPTAARQSSSGSSAALRFPRQQRLPPGVGLLLSQRRGNAKICSMHPELKFWIANRSSCQCKIYRRWRLPLPRHHPISPRRAHFGRSSLIR
jgi:hypothetical protein